MKHKLRFDYPTISAITEKIVQSLEDRAIAVAVVIHPRGCPGTEDNAIWQEQA